MKAAKRIWAVLIPVLFLTSSLAYSQTREDVINSYNQAHNLATQDGNIPEAIELFKETLALAEQVGSEADDIKERIANQIPRLSFTYAAQYVRERQLDRAISAFQESIRLSEKFGDEQTAARAKNNMPALYLNLGNLYFRDQENDTALELYEKAIELNPSYVNAYYQSALVYRRKGQLDRALELFDTSIDLARASGDSENVNRSQRAARDYLVFRASEAIENENYNRALDLLNRATRYGDSASLHYRFAETYNYLGRYSDALSSAQRALQLESGSRSDMARIYFELGLAQKGLDRVADACRAFENALYGDYRSPAEHQMEHELNCN
ncbi:tetratricopeptide repeat protein [Balneolaceae bacterium ANBcel3]|nr:tetratricopeptide repeat protein [Balneolaceae bacterium ANBcel3]